MHSPPRSPRPLSLSRSSPSLLPLLCSLSLMRPSGAHRRPRPFIYAAPSPPTTTSRGTAPPTFPRAAAPTPSTAPPPPPRALPQPSATARPPPGPRDPSDPPSPPLPPWHPPALIGAGAVLGCGAELPGAEPAGARSARQNGREVPHGAAGAAASSGAGGGMGTSGRPTRDERCGCGTAGRGDGASRERPPRGPAVLRAVVPVPPAGRTSGGPPRWAPTQFLPLTLPGGSRPPPTLPPRSLRGTVRRPCVGKG